DDEREPGIGLALHLGAGRDPRVVPGGGCRGAAVVFAVILAEPCVEERSVFESRRVGRSIVGAIASESQRGDERGRPPESASSPTHERAPEIADADGRGGWSSRRALR